MERGEISSELMGEKKILKFIVMMKKSQEFPVFVGRQKWTLAA